MRSLAPEILKGIRRGIEKESLRVRPDGTLAATPHRAALGAALTHPHITTDFSESQLELITGPHERVDACLEELTEIHKVVYRAIEDELMWAGSMPCNLPADDAIPIGRYGESNVGRAKSVYRMGPLAPLRPAHAGHLRHPLQPLDSRDDERAVLRADPQFPAPLVAAALPLRRLARGVLELRRRPAARAEGARAGGRCTRRTARRCAWGGSATRARRRRRSR
jgi:hypothetical protein